MRVLHLAKYYWPHSGGVERVVKNLAEGTAALGHEAEVLAVETRWQWGGSGRRGKPSKRQRTNVTKAFSFGALGLQELAPGYLTGMWKRADVIHVHHPHALADVVSLSRPSRAPIVVTQHASDPRTSRRWLARRALTRAAAIVVPSRAHVALCSELEGFESKIDIIPFGINESRWMDVPEAPAGRPARALFIGRLERYKGVDVLLRALSRTEDIDLEVIGHGPEAPRLQTLAKALELSDRVRWMGEYPDEDLPVRMADADFVVLPSVTVSEMFGLVPLEAMASSRPVITTDLPSGVKEVNVAGETGFVVPLRSVDSLADAMTTLAADPVVARKMGEAGRRRVMERFTRGMMTERHVELYEKLLSE
jgi:rhamnosyl/mannosyltransferase